MKTVLVTGAGSGIGAATARTLSRAGYAVAALARTSDEVEAVAKHIRQAGGEAIALTADVADEAVMRASLETLIKTYGRLDAVVANAGVNGVWAPIDDLTPEEWDHTMRINLRGTYLTLHLAIPHLKAEGGSIVVVSSINGTRTFTSPGASAYAVTKAGQLALVQQLAPELGRHRIRINAVCPGAIETAIDDNTQIRHAEKTEVPSIWPEGQIPITGDEPGRSEDVADAIAFLLSDAARHITGTPLWIDGGQSLLR
ncbi:NAD(P)-dependent dehydrogenase, short-chain alcohol dehydrogenase family [Rhizobium sp. RU20A]|nr:NAD(P)-dependent dehydrogenase, short-chain alcohol dehydrogenase family [Rhizobium sp. RU20A]